MSKTETIKRETARSVGRSVTPEQASSSTGLQNVLFGYIQDYMPQGYGAHSQKDVVLWAKFETADCNDITMDHVSSIDSPPPLLLSIGLSTGYTLWLIQPRNEAREVYSCTNDLEGPTKVATLLKSPDKSLGQDKYHKQRPLMAFVKRGREDCGEVKRVEFERNSIIDVKCNRRVLVVILQKRLVLLDAATFEKKWIIKTLHQPIDHWTNPIALGTRWIAVSDTKVHTHHLSLGGVSNGSSALVASTVMNTVKKGFAAITDTISGFTSKQPPPSSSPSTPPTSSTNIGQGNDEHPLPAVTILDLHHPFNGEVHVGEIKKISGLVVAHFMAYTGSDTHLTMLRFSNNGNILFTADWEGQYFNVYHISPSAIGSTGTRVDHLYTLYRGSTTGRVQDVSFSNDNRWVAVSTLNGTTHLFPISPYGGPITVRSHTNCQVVNQLSRYHTSAGIHGNHSLVSPLVINPLHQIKQPYSSTSSSHSGQRSNNSTNGDDIGDNICVRSCFGFPLQVNSKHADKKVQYSLYVFGGGNGELVEHQLEPVRDPSVTSNHDNTNNTDDYESSIGVNCKPHLSWGLLNKPLEDPISQPLSDDNPLISSNSQYQDYLKSSSLNITHDEEGGTWLSQVELLTYAPPTRRLWMGPQFNFKTVCRSDEDDSPSSSSSPTAILPSFQDIAYQLTSSPSSNLMSLKTNPVSVFNKGKKDDEGVNNSHDDAGVEVFGSWNDIAPRLKSDVNLEQEIFDAINDTVIDHSSLTVISGNTSLTGHM